MVDKLQECGQGAVRCCSWCKLVRSGAKVKNWYSDGVCTAIGFIWEIYFLPSKFVASG